MDLIWYSAEDWCNYRSESGHVEAFYILKHILNDVNRGGGGVLFIIK